MSGFTYPLALPAIPGFKGAALRYNKVVGINTAPGSLVSQVYEWPGERWESDLDFPIMTRADAAVLSAWLKSLRGPVGSFLMTPLDGGTPRGSAGGTPQVDGARSARLRTLAIKTGLGSVTGWLKADDYLQIGTGNAARLYAVLTDIDLVSGKATLDIVPPLRDAVTDNESIVVVNPVGKFMLTTGTVQAAIDNARNRQPVSITVVEDLRPLS